MKIGTSARSFDLSEEFFKNLSENKIDAIIYVEKHGYERISTIRKVCSNEQK